MSPGERYGCAVVRVRAPLLAQRADRLQQDAGLLDRVHASALAPVRLGELGVGGAALDHERRVQRAAARDPDVERGRLGDDAGVRLDAVRHGGDPAGAGGLLVGDRVDQHVAAQRHAEPHERLGGEHHRRHAALHVARAAAVELSVALGGAERVARPALARLDRDGVDVAVEQQAAAAARAREAGEQLRAALEAQPGRDLAAAGHVLRRRLPHARPPRRRRAGAARGAPAARPPRAARRRDGAPWCRSRRARRSARPARRAARRPRRGSGPRRRSAPRRRW